MTRPSIVLSNFLGISKEDLGSTLRRIISELQEFRDTGFILVVLDSVSPPVLSKNAKMKLKDLKNVEEYVFHPGDNSNHYCGMLTNLPPKNNHNKEETTYTTQELIKTHTSSPFCIANPKLQHSENKWLHIAVGEISLYKIYPRTTQHHLPSSAPNRAILLQLQNCWVTPLQSEIAPKCFLNSKSETRNETKNSKKKNPKRPQKF